MPKREPNQLRPISMIPHYIAHPEGSVLVSFGDTKVICTATVEDKVPGWMVGKGKGWVTAEYDMLPRSTHTRKGRDARKGKVNGRTQEISRLIGRSLRAIVDLEALGERMVTVDCDVLQADGGTRTASITGAYVALALAMKLLKEDGKIKKDPLRQPIAAISVGVLDGEPILDLDYSMDSRAEVDMNVVMTGDGKFAEVQGTGEEATFDRDQLNLMLDYALGALPTLVDVQKRAIDVPMGAEPVVVKA